MTAPTEPDIYLLWIPGTGASFAGDPRDWQQVESGIWDDEKGEWAYEPQYSMGHALMDQVFESQEYPDYFANLKVEPRWIAYDASITIANFYSDPKGESHYDSREVGRDRVYRELVSLPEGAKAIVGGYSQGAGAAFEFVNLVAAGHYQDVADKVVAGLYIANPFRPKNYTSWGLENAIAMKNGEDQELEIELDGFGVADPDHDGDAKHGAETHNKIWQIEIINPKDAICNADPDSYLRVVADELEYFELEGNLINWIGQGIDLYDNIKSEILSEIDNIWDILAALDRVARTWEEIEGYAGIELSLAGFKDKLPTEHVTAYGDKSFRKLAIVDDKTGNLEDKTILQAEAPYIATVLHSIFEYGGKPADTQNLVAAVGIAGSGNP
ncbi:hypothetical protein [Rhodococcus spongiicola]|uniref:PE-PPE domain-containing protein n=1 Tax=Rhodococcus spongiicola TaxID=2487352 RepID=A0A438B6F1_9NOCA|nr:hypothetical protein [Rhodococcus spongiicola]RVW06523.1 hypothetical protein EF834_03700 [Rhodococcus spongiicola]